MLNQSLFFSCVFFFSLFFQDAGDRRTLLEWAVNFALEHFAVPKGDRRGGRKLPPELTKVHTDTDSEEARSENLGRAEGQ